MSDWGGGRVWSAVRSVLVLAVVMLPGGLVLLGLLALALRRLRMGPTTTAA